MDETCWLRHIHVVLIYFKPTRHLNLQLHNDSSINLGHKNKDFHSNEVVLIIITIPPILKTING